MIIQEEITLDEAMLGGFKTYRNGCNFKIRIKKDGSQWLEYGCYCLFNLLTGKERLLGDFLENPDLNGSECRIDHLVKPETIMKLLKRKPCQCCGGFVVEK